MKNGGIKKSNVDWFECNIKKIWFYVNITSHRVKHYQKGQKGQKVFSNPENQYQQGTEKVKLTLKIKGKTYKVKTNKKGKATFKIKKLKKGTQKAVITYKGNANYKKATKKVKIKCR